MKKPPFNATRANPWTVVASFYPWLLLLAISALTWWLAQAFWLVVAPPKAPDLTPVPLQSNANPTAVTGNALDLFAQPQVAAAQAQTVPLPDIKVLGVTIAQPARLSYAIITVNGKTQSYRITDPLEGSPYTLAAVNADFIMLADSSGKTTKVPFGQPFGLDQSEAIRAKAAADAAPPGMAAPTPSPSLSPPSPNSPMGAPLGMPAAPSMPTSPNAPTPTPENDNHSQTQAALGGAVKGLQQDPSNYLTQMGVAATGQGYLVTDAMPARIKNRLGLQSGDKVIAVNGQNVGQNPAQDAQLMQQVQRTGQAQIQVQRGEQVVTVRQAF